MTMLYRENAIRRAPAPYKPTTSEAVRAALELGNWWWIGAGVASPLALIVAVWRAYDFIVAFMRLVHRF